MAVLAKGEHYFGPGGFPITLKVATTEPGGKPSHPHDVTETEHYHDFCELVIVSRGRGIHQLEGESFPVSAGDVFVVQGSQVHCFRERNDLTLLNVMYDPDRLALPLGQLRKLPGYSALFLLEPNYRKTHQFSSRLRLNRADLGRAEAIASRMAAEAENKTSGHEAALLGLLLEMMVFFSRHYVDRDTTEAKALLRIGEVVSTLESRYQENWTLAQLMKIAHLSRASLVRTFRQATGQTPIEYLIGRRIEAAMRLLAQTDLSMTDVAHEIGFADSNYFARQFRQLCGVTPSEFRRQHADRP